MNIFKLVRKINGFKKSVKSDYKFKTKQEIKQLKINNNLKELNIYNIKNMKQKNDAFIFKNIISYNIGFRIINSKGFNSLGFKDEVDIFFCDNHHKVIETYTKFKPNKFTQYHKNATEVYVISKNMIKYLNIKLNDYISLEKINNRNY